MLLGERLEQADNHVHTGKIVPKQMSKEDLLKLIEEKERDIASLHAEIDNLEKYKAFDEGAEATKALHTAFMNSGFSDEQAFKLVEKMMDVVVKTNAHLFMVR